MPETSHLRLAEEYRVIKRPILKNAFNKGAVPVDKGNLVMVTSSIEGEGKTYTALNLAMSIAMELDCTILLVDADFTMRSLTKTLGLETETGLVDILHDKKRDMGDSILATNIDRLKILPAGRKTRNPTELLASSRMAMITEELSRRYPDRIILFDTPPVLAATETASIMHHMGQVIVVVESSRTPTDVIKSCIAHIDDDKVIGMVLNKSRFHGKTGYYGGYGPVE
ncbi:MAG TPA: chromosome partitioning ATPase [Gammaproteobacteria bacterium]|nr:chromosome partitioning ATPase [Gammaproteobacteria bacterium]